MTRKKTLRRTIGFAAITAAIVAVGFALRPSPLLVDTGRVERGPMVVTVDEEGETRARERFTVSAPVPGLLMRIDLDEGDHVSQNQLLGRLEPLPLNQREREELVAQVGVAEAALRQANARKARAHADRELARRDLARSEGLGRAGVISVEELERSRTTDATAEEELNAAAYGVDVATSELRVAKAALVSLGGDAKRAPLVELRAPVSGRILRILEKSERVVQAGTAILTIGEPGKLEIVTDVLSTDAVNVSPGSPVLLEGWGGDHAIRARVRLVEPAGFTKVSALGVEEKRVNVISDFVDSPGPLGDDYRVEARIVTWSAQDALKVPASALFRIAQGWGTFVISGGRATRRNIEIGHRTETEVEVIRGLSENEVVILHAPNELADGMRVRTQ